ncbi:MAG: Hsp33 family molecular chaperone HslO [Oscillospiraceae bacterium]|jgi:molecular chaperone Hsp33|nr:Hsp33 family molecular chaperone HslO [Oscillospiraceae bacterium]
MDKLIHVITGDGLAAVAAVSSRELAERARVIHGASRTATAALGRTLAAAALLGSGLKNASSSLTLRITGGGAIGTVIAVAEADGTVRCCAGDPAADVPLRADGKLDVGGLVGRRGMLSVIRDEGSGEPYSGGTELVSGEIAEDLAAYLSASEGQRCAAALGVLVGGDGSVRQAGGFILRLLPGAPDDYADAFERNIAALGSVTRVLSDGGGPRELAFRVLEGFEPRVIAESEPRYECRCSRERVRDAVSGIGEAELRDIAEKGEPVEVTCRFCDAVYVFEPEELTATDG